MGQSRKSFAHFGKWLSSSVLSPNSEQQRETLKTSQLSGTASPSEEYIEALCQPSAAPSTNPDLRGNHWLGPSGGCGSWRLGSCLCSTGLLAAPGRMLILPGQGRALHPARVIHVLMCKREPATEQSASGCPRSVKIIAR